MKIKAIGFDIGGTLVNYNKPLNWSAYFDDAIKFMCRKNDIMLTEKRLEIAKFILQKYNTRVNPREKEVSSQEIFGEILKEWNEREEVLDNAIKTFFDFFQREAVLYDDVEKLLKYCKENAIKCSVYTDVAYGMDDELSLKDIVKISGYIDLKLTSRNVGYRKPHEKAFKIMIEQFNCQPQEMIFVGDEKKDIQGAHNVGMQTVLINKDEEKKEFNQDYTVTNLLEIIDIIKSF